MSASSTAARCSFGVYHLPRGVPPADYDLGGGASIKVIDGKRLYVKGDCEFHLSDKILCAVEKNRVDNFFHYFFLDESDDNSSSNMDTVQDYNSVRIDLFSLKSRGPSYNGTETYDIEYDEQGPLYLANATPVLIVKGVRTDNEGREFIILSQKHLESCIPEAFNSVCHQLSIQGMALLGYNPTFGCDSAAFGLAHDFKMYDKSGKLCTDYKNKTGYYRVLALLGYSAAFGLAHDFKMYDKNGKLCTDYKNKTGYYRVLFALDTAVIHDSVLTAVLKIQQLQFIEAPKQAFDRCYWILHRRKRGAGGAERKQKQPKKPLAERRTLGLLDRLGSGAGDPIQWLRPNLGMRVWLANLQAVVLLNPIEIKLFKLRKQQGMRNKVPFAQLEVYRSRKWIRHGFNTLKIPMIYRDLEYSAESVNSMPMHFPQQQMKQVNVA
uniref:PGA_cap domain-containing protein n=1 Tax=Macrostomum lignano TaxID=282301 RepID=A0A1I8G3E6_9PLAT